jgi:uncharacterized protein
MDTQQAVQILKANKPKFEKEGFVIVGLFGSHSTNDHNESSDVDVLYRLNDRFRKKYAGFRAFQRLADIQHELKLMMGNEVDIADINALNEIGKRYILSQVVHV